MELWIFHKNLISYFLCQVFLKKKLANQKTLLQIREVTNDKTHKESIL